MQIDLPPGKYRWRRPLSLPLAWSFVGLGSLMLGWLYWNRDSSSSQFFCVAMIAFATGLIIAGIFRDVD